VGDASGVVNGLGEGFVSSLRYERADVYVGAFSRKVGIRLRIREQRNEY